MSFEGVDIDRPHMTRKERLNQLVTLITEPMTYEQIGEAAGLARSASREYVDMLYDADRVHIAGWLTGRHRDRKLFLAGAGEDAPKPKEVVQEASSVHTHMNFKIKRPKPELTEDQIFKRPATVVNVHRDPLVAALFGEALEKVQEAA